jgi:hypothetical protein
VSYSFGLVGPCLAVDTACSSSLVAIHLADKVLRDGECSMAFVVGVSLILQPDLSIDLAKAGMLFHDGHCHSFDASANGYVRGEGVGAGVLHDVALGSGLSVRTVRTFLRVAGSRMSIAATTELASLVSAKGATLLCSGLIISADALLGVGVPASSYIHGDSSLTLMWTTSLGGSLSVVRLLVCIGRLLVGLSSSEGRLVVSACFARLGSGLSVAWLSALGGPASLSGATALGFHFDLSVADVCRYGTSFSVEDWCLFGSSGLRTSGQSQFGCGRCGAAVSYLEPLYHLPPVPLGGQISGYFCSLATLRRTVAASSEFASSGCRL